VSSVILSPCIADGGAEIARVGLVEPILTPPATTNDRRLSGHLSLVDEDVDADEGVATARLRVKSGTSLQTPSAAGQTRSSYMTTSTSASRMSGLSDFPIPPDMANDIKLFDSFFDDSARASIDHSSDPEPQPPVSRRMTFGGDEDIEDIAKSLSAP
jgi:serine/arginine repetitive matrix protein 2